MLRSIFPRLLFLHLLIFAYPSPNVIAGPGPAPDPPRNGSQALHQIVLDLGNPAVVMSVSAEPGEEDLPALCALRLGQGARIVSVYVTDGGATPDDVHGSLPLYTGAERKSEAENMMRGLGGEAFFLGFPDYGIVSRRESLERLWNRDSLVGRMAYAIRTFRPDCILYAADYRTAEGDSVRSGLIRSVLLEALKLSEKPSPVAWSVPRVLQEARRGGRGAFRVNAGRVDAYLKKSFAGIAAGRATAYRSLRGRIRTWNRSREGMYMLLHGRNGPGSGILDGLTVIPPSLGETRQSVDLAATDAARGPVNTALVSLRVAIAGVENLIAAREAALSPLERRVLISWNENLEDLRCAVLGIDLKYVISDTVISPRELITLRFPRQKKFPAGGRAEIIFPSAMDSTWFINRSEAFRFSFALPDTFTMITPEVMELNRPLATIGSSRHTISTGLPFVVAHRDADPIRNFAFRREIPLGVGPVQTAEVLTPFVRLTPGERLVVQLQNISGDPYRGTLRVGDSVARDSRKPLTLLRNMGIVRDTLPLKWAVNVPDGDYVVQVHVGKGKNPVGYFTARKFDAVADTDRTVGLYTGLAGSPVEDGLRRLHVPCRLLDGGSALSASTEIRTVIVDRDAFALRPDAARFSGEIAAWVREGGHCVMFHQAAGSGEGNPLAGMIWFAKGGIIAPESPVRGDTAAGVLSRPNPVSQRDWEGWIISRAWSPLVISPGTNATVQVQDASTGEPLVAAVSFGKGTLTVVGLDLSPQIQIVLPGAYRLLANLVSH